MNDKDNISLFPTDYYKISQTNAENSQSKYH